MEKSTLELREDLDLDSLELTIRCRGELDISNSSELVVCIERVLARHPRILTLDMTGITFMGTDGLRLLAVAIRRCNDSDVRLHLKPSPIVEKVLHFAGADVLVALTN